MKKVTLFLTLGLLGLALTLTDCRKKKDRTDPCEGVICEPDEKCVDGKCVPIRRK